MQTLLIRIGVGLLAAALMVALVGSWHSRGQEITRLTAWQNAVVASTTDATVEPDAKGVRKPLAIDQVPAAIARLKRGLDSCHAAREQANGIAEADKRRADVADKALADLTVVFNRDYATVAARIDALAGAKPAATAELQCAAIGEDSKAAWEGWK